VKTVLFVCVQNSGRSQMAEALFNHMRPTGFRAISAGTLPAEGINPVVVEAMIELGLSMEGQRPKLVTTEMVRNAYRVITMGCGADFCPARFLPKVQDWALDDPKGKPIEKVREIRDEVRRRVEALVKELAKVGEGLTPAGCRRLP